MAEGSREGRRQATNQRMSVMTYHGNVGRVHHAKATALSVGDLWDSL